MTVLLDIAALGAIVLALTFVPAQWYRADRRITKQLEQAEANRGRSPAPRPPRPARTAGPARPSRERAGRDRGSRLTNPATAVSPRTSP